MSNYRQLTEQVEHYVQARFTTQAHPELLYHNISHTSHVVLAATEIANHYRLGDRDLFIIIAAAWFHDIGYLQKAEGHEAIGACEAVDFLNSLQIDQPIVDAVSSCILATKMPQQPNSLSEQILCDADLFHLGTHLFWDNYKELREEYGSFYNHISEEEWQAKTLKMMQAHQYLTGYCRQLLTTGKEENKMRLLQKNTGK